MTTNTLVSGYNPITKQVVDLDGNATNIIGWTFHLEEIKKDILISDIRSAMLSVGLPEDLVHDIKKEDAMRKTVRALKRDKVIKEVSDKVITEIKGDKDSSVQTFQIDEKIIEKLPEGLQAKFRKVDALTFDITTGVIRCDDKDVEKAAYEILGVRQIAYDRAQFVSFMINLIEKCMGRMVVRTSTAHYFFDLKGFDHLSKLVRMIKILDGNAEVQTTPYIKMAEQVETAVKSTNKTYVTEIEKIFDEIAEREIDGSLTERILNNRKKDLKELRDQAEMSLIALNAQTDLVLDAVKRVDAKINDAVPTKKLTAEEAKVEAKKAEATAKARQDMIILAKHAVDNGVPSEVIADLIAKEGLTLEDLAE